MSNRKKFNLDKPGAGLPFFERVVIRLVVPKLSKIFSWKKVDEIFDAELKKMLDTYMKIAASDRVKPVLVPRLIGLEDSSRFWSPVMVIEHVLIVSRQMCNTIIDLNNSRKPNWVHDVGKLKPNASDCYKSIEDDFLQFRLDYRTLFPTDINKSKSNMRFYHPWFGELNMVQWHLILAFHVIIHRRQMEKILHIICKFKS